MESPQSKRVASRAVNSGLKQDEKSDPVMHEGMVLFYATVAMAALNVALGRMVCATFSALAWK